MIAAIELNKEINQNKYYHNAKTLLSIYSSTVWETSNKYEDIVYCCESDYGIRDINGLAIVASMSDEAEPKNITDRLLAVAENKLIIDTIHSALMRLKDYPRRGEQYYQIVYKNYFVKYKYAENELIEYLGTSRSTYFRRRREAIHLFGVSLWKLTIPKVLDMFETKLGQNWNGFGTDMAF